MQHTKHSRLAQAHGLIRLSAIYDLIVTIGFAFLPTASLIFVGLQALHAELGLSGELPDASSPSTMMFVNLMGSVVTAWALFRIFRPSLAAGAADTLARALFSLGMITALAQGASPLIVVMLALEIAWGVAQAAVLVRARPRPAPAAAAQPVVSSDAHR
ncbi:hypothetical protein [Pseudoclavibacter sp. VKM Ac-2867]|uniref:hypothetical protein n=1 Tax=Pseudoclavibacter sp. VKM Ac-2867 TaxID=2783829 RepID=UPI00188BDCAC|nr:hypothetical protein [Pseudoclavibacter sp. VKM Ac-2867]MBF4460850.1 hypothetical protein [Pseudoclavibacter sp. VKM Ac-2867]